MQIDVLRYFVELARVGSFYGAAKNIFISQQGLSKAIGALESELGVALIERESRGVRLTSAGEVFLAHANSILADYSSMLDELYAQHRIATPHDTRLVTHVTYYPSQISEPFVRHMQVVESVNVVEEPFQQIVDGATASDGSELFLCDFYGAEARKSDYPDLIFEPLVSSRSGVLWKDGSPLAHSKAIHREQLADIPLAIDSHREMRRLAEYIMQDYPLNNIRLGVANPRARIEYSNAADNMALLFDSFGFMLARLNPNIPTDGWHFTPFSTPRAQMQIGFLYSKHARPNVRARHGIDMLRAFLHDTYADYFDRFPLK